MHALCKLGSGCHSSSLDSSSGSPRLLRHRSKLGEDGSLHINSADLSGSVFINRIDVLSDVCTTFLVFMSSLISTNESWCNRSNVCYGFPTDGHPLYRCLSWQSTTVCSCDRSSLFICLFLSMSLFLSIYLSVSLSFSLCLSLSPCGSLSVHDELISAQMSIIARQNSILEHQVHSFSFIFFFLCSLALR